VKPVAIIENVKEAGGSVTGWWGSAKTFLTEVRNELKRVTWPSRKEVYATTLVVILTSIFFGVYLFALDGVLNIGIQQIFKWFGVA
jgi:preprotein translocase subunit SecE